MKWRAPAVVATPGRGRGKGRGSAENRGGKRGLQERYAERVLRGLGVAPGFGAVHVRGWSTGPGERMRTSLVQRTSVDWDRVIYESRVPHRLSLFIPLLALRTGLELVPALPAELEGFFTRLIAATMILVVALVIDAALTAAHALYLRLPNAGLRPITSYIQLAKVFVYVAGIFTIARIADQSPWFFVSGLGALMAIIGDHRCLPNHLHGPRSGKT